MALKDKHLADGEEIRLDLRTHWKALVGPLVLLVLLVAFVAAAAVLTRDSDQRTWIVLGVAVVALALAVPGVLVPAWRWNSTRYVFTNRRVSNRYGLLTKRGRDIPLYRINDVSYEKGVLDRMLGCGTLIISDASEQAGVRLHDVPRVEQVQVRVNELLYHQDDNADDDGAYPPGDPRSQHGPRGF